MEPENTPLGKGETSTNHEFLGSMLFFGGEVMSVDFAVEYQLKISKDQDTAAQDLVVGALAMTGP